MRKSHFIWFLAGALTIVLAVVLNPSAERHRAGIKDSIAERSQLAAVLRIGDLVSFVSHYHSLGIASYTTVNERVLSVGALGMVFVLESDAEK